MHPRNNGVLLDASAVLAMLLEESGSSMVEDVLDESSISAVNFGEVVSALAKRGTSDQAINNMLFGLFPDVIPFSRHLALHAGMMITQTKPYGLSFGNRACIATGISHGMKIYTADKSWANLSMGGLEIILIR